MSPIRPNAIKNLKDILSSLDYREWEKESIATLNEILKLLRGHYTYVPFDDTIL